MSSTSGVLIFFGQSKVDDVAHMLREVEEKKVGDDTTHIMSSKSLTTLIPHMIPFVLQCQSKSCPVSHLGGYRIANACIRVGVAFGQQALGQFLRKTFSHNN